MRKMKKGLAIAAGILAVFTVLGAIFSLISNITMYSRAGVMLPVTEKIRIYGMGVVNIVLPVLLAVCCFRRKLGIFPGVVMGLHGLRALYGAVTNLLSGFTMIKVGYAYKAVGSFCGSAANLLRIALFVLLFLLCISKKDKKNGLAVFGFIPVALLAAVATFFSGLPFAPSFSDAVSNVMTMAGAIATAVIAIIGGVGHILAAAAINGAKENEADPYAQQMAQFQAAQYQQAQAQYQMPQYQQPYQAPQYQQPQYQPQYQQAPQQPVYQAPQYQAPQQPTYQAPQYQQPQYQPQYQAPQYQQPYQAPQQPMYQAPQYQAPQYEAPQAPSQEQ